MGTMGIQGVGDTPIWDLQLVVDLNSLELSKLTQKRSRSSMAAPAVSHGTAQLGGWRCDMGNQSIEFKGLGLKLR